MGFVNSLLGFDKLIGAMLVRVIYYVGLAGILIATVIAMFSGFGMGIIQGIGTFVIAPIGGLIALLCWRFVSELYMVLFKIGNDLADVRANLMARPPAPPAA
ncbi:MAG: DUF4282 domain-containing protein [Alphaproteobacteria bacterium]|nr:DUF4282 domain-containing protein [Alphaproteobacteria bacterium]